MKSTVDVVLDVSFGDNGKGRFVDFLAPKYDYVVRFNGGNNAGHTLISNNKKYVVHALPSGILHPHINNVIANGCVIDPIQLYKEIKEYSEYGLKNRLFISSSAHVILPKYIEIDKKDAKIRIGSTGKGIGPTYAAKMNRTGFRMYDLVTGKLDDVFEKDIIETIKPFVFDTFEILKLAISSEANILLEGAQGTLLDIDHGTYPYVTSSNTTIGAALTGTGLNHKNIRKVFGITKAYMTRVGEGPFITEDLTELGERLRVEGKEFGSTTGRPRRCGWLDVKSLKDSCKLNGVDELVLTKIDVLDSFEEIPFYYYNQQKLKGWKSEFPTCGIKKFEDLPASAKEYIKNIESLSGIPISHISTSPERGDMIVL